MGINRFLKIQSAGREQKDGEDGWRGEGERKGVEGNGEGGEGRRREKEGKGEETVEKSGQLHTDSRD